MSGMKTLGSAGNNNQRGVGSRGLLSVWFLRPMGNEN